MDLLDRHGRELNNCGNCGGGDLNNTNTKYISCQTPGKNCGVHMRIDETCENHTKTIDNILSKGELYFE